LFSEQYISANPLFFYCSPRIIYTFYIPYVHKSRMSFRTDD